MLPTNFLSNPIMLSNKSETLPEFADSILIMQVDQAGCHRAKRLRLPQNIILIFQPAHSPELNPIERVWLHLKQGLRFTLPKNMDELRLLVKNRLSEMTKSVIASLVGRDSILDALSVASLLCFGINWYNMNSTTLFAVPT